MELFIMFFLSFSRRIWLRPCVGGIQAESFYDLFITENVKQNEQVNCKENCYLGATINNSCELKYGGKKTCVSSKLLHHCIVIFNLYKQISGRFVMHITKRNFKITNYYKLLNIFYRNSVFQILVKTEDELFSHNSHIEPHCFSVKNGQDSYVTEM